MSFDPREIEVRAPRTLAEATALMADRAAGWVPIAGGTDLMVQLASGAPAAARYLSVVGIPELRGIVERDGWVTMGAATTYAELQAHALMRSEFPCLVRAAAETGSVAIQSRGTIGGNIMNASPAADTPPALIAYGAELLLVSASGERWLACESLYKGYKQLDLRPGELVARIRMPRPAERTVHYYRKVGPRKAQAISKVVLAAVAELASGRIRTARLALGSVAPVTARCHKAERLFVDAKPGAALAEAVAREIQADIAPIDDIRSTAEYRRLVVGNLVRRFVAELGAAL